MAIVLSPATTATAARVEEPGPPAGQFRALTYNVAGLPAVLSGSEPDVNTELISPLLNDYDLVLVQESWINPDPPIPGLEFFHEVLVSQVTHPYLSQPAPPPREPDPRRPDALVSDGLNRMSRFPFGALTRVMWNDCFGGANTSDGGAGDCLAQKGFSVARTTVARGVEIDVYNLHGEAGNTPDDQGHRAAGFEQLAEFIAVESAGRPVIVGGDFNLNTDRAPDGGVFDTFLAATGLTDVCAVVDCGDDADRIDKFVFRSGGGVTIQPLEHRFERDRFRRQDGAPLSDHDALAVTFAWSGSAGGGLPTTQPPDEAASVAPPAVPVAAVPRFTG
ncbi:MAG: endonuclease/exonuclease/phosphatase family protein [Acidimicrobiales bacterium]